MTVWTLEMDEYGGNWVSHLYGVYSTKERAEERAKALTAPGYRVFQIREMEIDAN